MSETRHEQRAASEVKTGRSLPLALLAALCSSCATTPAPTEKYYYEWAYVQATLCDDREPVDRAATEFEKYGPPGAESVLRAAADAGECDIHRLPVYTERARLLGEYTHGEDTALALGMTAFIPDSTTGEIQVQPAYMLVPKERTIIEDGTALPPSEEAPAVDLRDTI